MGGSVTINEATVKKKNAEIQKSHHRHKNNSIGIATSTLRPRS